MFDKHDLRHMERVVKTYYKKHGRYTLPWRKTKDPYKILVSEFMLQQTQVARVIPKYISFVRRFPTCTALAQAPVRDVLAEWSGLGYNRRAKYLRETARQIVEKYKGKVPTSPEVLKTFPGIGPYTAAAVCVFSRNVPLSMLETNIRTVLIHYLFTKEKKVSDKKLYQVLDLFIENDKENPRELYWALMDYGTFLKTSGVRTNSRSPSYTKQSLFKGSNREIRGAIVKVLTKEEKVSLDELAEKTGFSKEKIHQQLTSLLQEGMVLRKGDKWFL